MSKMRNEGYQRLREFVKDHHGFGQSDFAQHPEIVKLYEDTMKEISLFDNKKIKLTYKVKSDIRNKIGKIKVVDNKIRFYEGKKTSKFQYLDAGLFEGWYSVLIPLSIE